MEDDRSIAQLHMLRQEGTARELDIPGVGSYGQQDPILRFRRRGDEGDAK